MKTETAKKVMEWIGSHEIHQNMKKDIATGTGLGVTTVNIVVEWLIAHGDIRVARNFGNAKAYELVRKEEVKPHDGS
jgi:hypothetical protein